MPGIFVCYRREDSAGHAGRLYDRLAQHFGRNRVFRDVDHLRAGQDFVQAIARAVGGCDACVVVIGRDWLHSVDEQGQRRLDQPEDFVRLELQSALERGILTVPVLVDGAAMVRAAEMPGPLRALARRQAVELSESRWDFDVQHLLRELSPAVRQPVVSWKRRMAWAAAAVLVLAAGILAARPWWTHSW